MNKITSINGILLTPQNDFYGHVKNDTVHVTEEERTTWNAKTSVNAKGILIATQGDLEEHINDIEVHTTKEERALWNSKAEASEIDAKVSKEIFNAHTENTTVHVTAEERSIWNAKQDTLVDKDGNITLDRGLTTEGIHNALGGINVPIATGCPAGTSATNRAYALGLAQAVFYHQVRTYWRTAQCTATGGVTINHIVPGCYCEAILTPNTRTALSLPTVGAVGLGNYGHYDGYVLPVRMTSHPSGWSKITLQLGTGGAWTENTEAGVDGYRLSPTPGALLGLSHVFEITMWYSRQDGSYRARVRQIAYRAKTNSHIVRTTESQLVYDYNTGPMVAMCKLIIARHGWHSTQLYGGVWMVISGGSGDTIIRLADIYPWDTLNAGGIGTVRLDVQADTSGGSIQADTPSAIIGLDTLRYGLETLERRWITSVNEETWTAPI